jgi:predicted transcriptional regulator
MRAIELLRVVLGADLTPTEKLTLMAIIHSASWETWEGQASIKQLAAMCKVSEKSVKRALETLTDLELISRSRSVSKYGEVSATNKVNCEKINDFAVGHDDPTLGHDDPTLGHDDHTLGHGDPTLGHSVHESGQDDPTLGHSVHESGQDDPAYILSSSVLISVPSVDSSVDQSVDRSVDGSADDAAREAAREAEPDVAPTPAWRTLPAKSNGWLFSRAYYNIVKDDLGHDHNGITTITNAIAAAKVYPDRVDIQAFLAQHPHLIH